MSAGQAARVQVDKSELDEAVTTRSSELQQEQHPSAVFNTWYGKWAGGDKQARTFRSPYRCNVARDSGYTRSKGPYFCLWFARGTCYKGADCENLHRIPEKSDLQHVTNATDCFGRTKHANYREDMAGVGSLLSENRTLFVGYFGAGQRSTVKLTENVRKQFSEWGHVERVKLGKNGAIAFITYAVELNAQFAKEAMSNQTITGSETLVVRWAREDIKSKNRDRPGAQTNSSEEARIRKIVRAVLKSRRAAQSVEMTSQATQRPKEDPDADSDGSGSVGLFSAAAASRLNLIKKRKIATESQTATNTAGSSVGSSVGPGVGSSAGSTDPSSISNSPTQAASRKRGLVDYD